MCTSSQERSKRESGLRYESDCEPEPNKLPSLGRQHVVYIPQESSVGQYRLIARMGAATSGHDEGRRRSKHPISDAAGHLPIKMEARPDGYLSSVFGRGEVWQCSGQVLWRGLPMQSYCPLTGHGTTSGSLREWLAPRWEDGLTLIWRPRCPLFREGIGVIIRGASNYRGVTAHFDRK